MTREEYIASWVADCLFQGRAKGIGHLTKSDVRSIVREGIAEGERTWPDFARDLGKMEACDKAGGNGDGGRAGS